MSSTGIDGSHIATIIIAIITAIGAYAGAKVSASAQRKAAEPENWRMLTAEMKDFFQTRIDAQNRRIEKLEKDVSAHAMYARWLDSLGLPRPPFLSFDEWKEEKAEQD